MNGQCISTFGDENAKPDHHTLSDQPQAIEYNIIGILNFLQNEWVKMGIERSKWEYERAELQSKIALLQNERKGQENLKNDLVRRIKMLEFALQKERCKNYLLRQSNELGVEATEHISEEANTTSDVSKSPRDDAISREDRLRLRQYIQRMGLADKLVEVRANCVKELLGILDTSETARDTSDSSAGGTESETLESALAGFSFLNSEDCNSANTTNLSHVGVNPTESEPSLAPFAEESDDVEIASALAEFDLLVAQQSECAGVVGSTAGSMDSLSYPVDINPHSIADPEWIFGDQSALVDRLTEKYRMCMPFPRGGSGGGARVKKADKGDNSTPSPSYDEGEFYGTAAADDLQPPPTSCYLDTPAQLPAPTSSPSAPGTYGDDFDVDGTVDAVRMLEKAAQATTDGASATTFSLGDLASLTVANEADTQRRASALDNLDGVGPVATALLSADGEQQATTADGTTNASRSAVPAWTAKYTLRSHFDSIRAILFHHTEQILLTAGEDHTLKLWNLTKTVQAKKSSCLDVEPMYTCRGHNSPVLCIALTSFSEAEASAASPSPSSSCDSSTSSVENNCAFSGSLNGEIRSWRFGDLQLLPYEAFNAGVNGPILRGHTDAVWSLAVRADGVLLSASADGTVRLWSIPPSLQQSAFGTINTNTTSLPPTSLAANRVYRPAALLPPTLSDGTAVDVPLPTSVTFLYSDPDSFAVGLTTGEVCVISLESGRLLTLFASHQSAMLSSVAACDDALPSFAGSVNSLVSHPTLPLLISAHENKQIRFLNTSLGKCVHSMVAHLDAVTSIAIDAQGSYLLSASHDSSIRLWDIETKTCVQELTSHRKKFDESIHCVAFHPTRPLMASAGADGLAKVFV
uniref:Striatin N-terminal domain-containing protein n=2 Tax=Schistocephalus solidus TaxID=70667 RepID=A0A0X3NNB7_SCHSO